MQVVVGEDSGLAEQIVRGLLETYRVTVVKGREQGRGPGGRPWSLEELRILQEAVADLAGAMGGADRFIATLGGVTARRAEMRARGTASGRGVKFTASSVSIDKWTVVHELTHTWDARSGWRLSRALEAHTGGHTSWPAMLLRRWRGRCDEERRWPGCNRFGYFYGGRPPAGSDENFNRKEDFAEAVAAYVYPAEAQSRVERFEDDERYGEFLYYPDYTQTRRWAFVDGVIRGEIAVR